MKMGDRECVEEKTPLKPHFVLIHGISGGGWCWYKLKSMMCNFGYKVSCIDLKGAGLDPTDPKTILSFDEYNKPLLDFMSNLPHNEKVILVGHSAGGLSVTQATHKFPDKISLVIYVAATMLKNGFVTEQDVKDGVPDGVKCDDGHGLEIGLGVNQSSTSTTVKNEPQRKLQYYTTPQEDITLESMVSRPGPVYAIVSARFPEDDECIERVSRVYIKTLHDEVLKPKQQDNMIAKWPPSHIYDLESDHRPNFSCPFALFGLFVKIATSMVCT